MRTKLLLKFIPGQFGRGPLFLTKTDVSAVPSTAIISVNPVSYTHLYINVQKIIFSFL